MIDMKAKKRLRRSMLFLNCQKPALIRDPYVYRPDSIMLDLEDAVAENQKDAARFSLYHALRTVDYRGVERVVRINGLDTPHWQEDVRVCVAGGADVIRTPNVPAPLTYRPLRRRYTGQNASFTGRRAARC